MNIFTNVIPPRSPVVVVLIEQEGCGACEEYHPIFEQAAARYAQMGLPIIKMDAGTQDPESVRFMNVHGVQSTPTVIAATLFRGPVGRLEGVSTLAETQRMFEVAWAHNRR